MTELTQTLAISRAALPAEKASILLVDDNPANLLSLRAILDDLGHNLVDARSGAEAIELAKSDEFAVILLDVLMPGLSGFETAKLVRDLDRATHTPIIFLTASDIDREQIEEGYALGAVDFLIKPLVPLALRAKVKGFIDLFEDKRQARREAHLFRMLVQGTGDYAIFLLDPNGYVVTWNAGAERLKGYTSKEIIGQHFSVFYPPDRLEQRWPEHELEVARAVGRFEDEGWRIRKDGTRFWANVVITALRDDQGALFGFSKVTRDLTGRMHAEEALRRSEERFRLLVETANDYAIFLLDPRGCVASWNIGAERIKQYRAEEIIGQHFSVFYPQEAIDRGWPAYELVVAQAEGRFEDEGWRIRKDGTQFWANVVITALRNENGELLGFSKITRDMTERKQAEENLRRLAEEAAARRVAEENARTIQEQRERLRVTLASIGDAVISTDAAGLTTYLNPVAENLVGWKTSEASGKPLSDVFKIVNEESRQPVENPAMRALREGKIVGLANHTILIAKDGTECPVDDSAAPIRNADGRVIGSVLVFRDITERKLAEAALRNADRRKDEFLATLAHELRNPLAPLRNALQILKMPRVDAATTQRSLEMMERQVQHLVLLVDDLLDVSRVMGGKVTLRNEPIELATIIAHAVEQAQPLIQAQQHKLQIDVPPESLLVDADLVRLAQVVSNLLTNSAKYTEPGGTIRLSAREADGEVVLRVVDNGIGIASEVLPHIFELFVQADQHSTKVQGGMGIGLTLVKNLVEMHGGRVEAHSAGLDMGSEFVVRLPCAAKIALTVNNPIDANQNQDSAAPTLGHRIVVVDDNQDAAVSLSMMLRLQGHTVKVAHDGMAALEVAETFRPDVMLLDIGMPGMDGFEVARRVRAIPELSATTLAALTGWGQDSDRRKTTEAGFDHHLLKPIDLQHLAQVLDSVTARKR